MIKKGTIVVRIGGQSKCNYKSVKYIGTIIECYQDHPSRATYFNKDTGLVGEIQPKHFRLATNSEISAYNRGIKNIKWLHKPIKNQLKLL